MKNAKILMIMPYFGTFPVWFSAYLYSCSKNSFIDFLIITDNKNYKCSYSNITFLFKSFEEYCMEISSKLGIKFLPQTAYKLCDVRPFFEFIHEEYLNGYDFYGYGDLDVIYGNLRLILSERKLLNYDLITSHADRIAGHFTVIRKGGPYSKVCFKMKDWRKRLEDEYIYGMDEHDFTSQIFPFQSQIWRMYRVLGKHLGIHCYSFFDAFNLIFNRLSKHHIHEYLTSPLPKDGEQWIYDIVHNKIVNPFGKELPYLHFLFFKKTPFWNTPTYWKDDFWKVKECDLEKGYGYIVFDNQKVEYKTEL